MVCDNQCILYVFIHVNGINDLVSHTYVGKVIYFIDMFVVYMKN
jgi:hypothetical protein